MEFPQCSEIATLGDIGVARELRKRISLVDANSLSIADDISGFVLDQQMEKH
jgi:hypothetical protein